MFSARACGERFSVECPVERTQEYVIVGAHGEVPLIGAQEIEAVSDEHAKEITRGSDDCCAMEIGESTLRLLRWDIEYPLARRAQANSGAISRLMIDPGSFP